MENYRILGRIGEGAHGIVYKAKDIKVCVGVTAFSIVSATDTQYYHCSDVL